jgi:hypothetical protein
LMMSMSFDNSGGKFFNFWILPAYYTKFLA